MTWRMEPDVGEVESRWGELQEPVWWTGRTWAVTGLGIERRDGGYTIEVDRLGDRRSHPVGQIAEWPAHIASKSAVFDQDDFMKAFLIGLAIHQGRYAPLPEGWIEVTLAALDADERGSDGVAKRLGLTGPDEGGAS